MLSPKNINKTNKKIGEKKGIAQVTNPHTEFYFSSLLRPLITEKKP